MGTDNTYGETNFNPEKTTDDIVSSILSHCKTNMELYRDRWLNDTLSKLEKGKYSGKFFAYKDISDGIRNGFFEPKTDE